jgi:HKD family nuclease
MSHDIIDNRETQLLDRIRGELSHAEAVKFAVGYFFLSGLEVVADQLYNVRELYLKTLYELVREPLRRRGGAPP